MLTKEELNKLLEYIPDNSIIKDINNDEAKGE